MKKSLLMQTVLLMLTASMVLAGCGGNGDPQNNGDETVAPSVTTQSSTETGPALDEYGREVVADDLPQVRFDGETFTVHTRGNVEKYEWLADEVTGEALNDAIYKRNTTIEDKYGITLNIVAEGSWADYSSSTLPKLRAAIQAQTGEYDLIAGYSSPFTSMATTGLLLDLNSLEYLNFDKPWWWKNFTEEMTIDGINYFGLGALSLSAIYSMSATFFNPDLMKEIHEDVDVYQIVLDGKWTWDKMIELCQDVNRDLDGDNVMTAADRYGAVFANSDNTNNIFLVSTGERWSKRNSDGYPEISINVDKMHTILDKLLKLYNEEECVSRDTEVNCHDRFMNGNALFTNSWLYYAQTKFSGKMEAYGVLPNPKYDEAQENYCTWIQGGMHLYSIPIDVKDVDRASFLTEAFAAESYRSLLPSYYEVILKNRYFADEASSKMMDIMYDSIMMDFADVFNSSIGMRDMFKQVINSGNNSFTSTYSAFKKVYDKKLTTLLDGIRASTSAQ